MLDSRSQKVQSLPQPANLRFHRSTPAESNLQLKNAGLNAMKTVIVKDEKQLEVVREKPMELLPEMRDAPAQAQAKSFFGCTFNHNHRSGQMADSALAMESPMMGCIVCKAQIKIGEKFIQEQEEHLGYFEGKLMSFQALIQSLIPDPSKNPKEKMIEGC